MGRHRRPNPWPFLALLTGAAIWFLLIAVAVKK